MSQPKSPWRSLLRLLINHTQEVHQWTSYLLAQVIVLFTERSYISTQVKEVQKCSFAGFLLVECGHLVVKLSPKLLFTVTVVVTNQCYFVCLFDMAEFIPLIG